MSMPTTFPPLSLLVLMTLGAGCAGTHSTLGPAERAGAFALPAHADVPPAPDIVVERFAVIEAPPRRIYQLLADVERWPGWDPNVAATRAHAGRPLQAGDRFFQHTGGYRIEARVLDAEPGRWLRWRGQAADGGGIVGVHSFRLVPLEGGRTLVINREEFSRWYLRLIGWATDVGVGKQFQRTMDALARRAAAPSAPGAAAVLGGGAVGPATEGAVEGARLRVAEQEGHLRDGHPRVGQVAER